MSSTTKTAFIDFFFEKKVSIIPRANYLKLEQSYRNGSRVVHAFFENSDDFEFYRTALNYVYRDYKIVAYYQEGKQNVIDGFKEVDWIRYDKSLVLFFADKDYDDLITPISYIDSINFFYTNYYSIENYLVTEEAFEIVLSTFFTHMRPELSKELLILFVQAQQKFHATVKSITRFILIFRRFKKVLDLDKITMTDFVNIKDMVIFETKLVDSKTYFSVTRDPKISNFDKKLVREHTMKDILVAKCRADQALINFKNILGSQNLLKSISEVKRYVRGKYELWFFTELISTVEGAVEKIYERQNINKSVYPLPRKKFPLTNQNAFHLLASKLSFPQDVLSFLKTNFIKIP